jgi:hypothetical protein
MKAGDQPELLLQIGRSKVLAKGPDAINVVKWPLRFVITTIGFAILAMAALGYAYGAPVALHLARLF